jgi:O-antigen/teichoic acid export membrane protein
MPIMRFAGAIVVLIVGPTLVGFLIAWAAAEVMTALASWLFAARASRRMLSMRGMLQPRRVLRAHPGLATFTVSSNISFTLESVTKQFLTVVVGIFAGPVAAGHYRIAYQVGQGIAKLAELLSRAVYSELTRAHYGDERDNLPKLFRTSVRFSMLAGAVILAIVLLAGKPALILVAGEAFAPAYPLLVLLSIAAALEFGGVNFQPALLATDRPALVLNLRLAVTALLLGLLVTLLPSEGAWGAAAATAAASLAGLVLFGVAAWMAVHKRA